MKFLNKNALIEIIVILIIISYTKEDLPIHCRKSQIIGKWIFNFEKASKMNSMADKYNKTCFHELPSNEKSSYKTYLKRDSLDLINSDMNVEFFDDYTCQITDEGKKINGTYTMIYNEGLEFKYKSEGKEVIVFFFLKYDSQGTPGTKWSSYCYSTLIGWYRIKNDDDENDYRGCVFGHKDIEDYNSPTNDLPDNIMFYVHNISEDNEGSNLRKNGKFRFAQLTLQSKVENSLKDFLYLSSQFKYQSNLVSYINDKNLGWTAKNYEILNGKTIYDVREMIQKRKMYIGDEFNDIKIDQIIEKLDLKSEPSDGSHLEKLKGKTIDDIDIATLPKHFNWLNHVSPPSEQGGCGSCYAVAYTSGLEARFRIKYGKILKKYSNIFGDNLEKFRISRDHILKCSVYNQGCDGGYGVLVGKFFKDFEVFLDQCYDKDKTCFEQTNECEGYPELKNLELGVKDYYYVGGAYIKSNEENIMKDLYLNGPLAISFEPEEGFGSYSNGIYSGKKINLNEYEEQKRIDTEWEKVDHSILLCGWGEEEINGNTIKYWLIQNSWGNKWGVYGFGKFLKGGNLNSIESSAEAGIPILKEKRFEE